jgi:hypothetical protein
LTSCQTPSPPRRHTPSPPPIAGERDGRRRERQGAPPLGGKKGGPLADGGGRGEGRLGRRQRWGQGEGRHAWGEIDGEDALGGWQWGVGKRCKKSDTWVP